MEELLDRHLAKEKRKPSGDGDDDESSTRRRLTSTRREALSLYRDVLRATRYFVWPNPQGVTWRDVLRENARKEFDHARFETDPEVVTRLLIGGRDAVESAVEKLVAQIEKDKASRPR